MSFPPLAFKPCMNWPLLASATFSHSAVAILASSDIHTGSHLHAFVYVIPST